MPLHCVAASICPDEAAAPRRPQCTRQAETGSTAARCARDGTACRPPLKNVSKLASPPKKKFLLDQRPPPHTQKKNCFSLSVAWAICNRKGCAAAIVTTLRVHAPIEKKGQLVGVGNKVCACQLAMAACVCVHDVVKKNRDEPFAAAPTKKRPEACRRRPFFHFFFVSFFIFFVFLREARARTGVARVVAPVHALSDSATLPSASQYPMKKKTNRGRLLCHF
ncbi:hypothetical protein TW95_gp1672 [Pandoravirus inopinatum]|uniref:Uncharacterized protein n=1 Tax=Pandoravirus inopinatum TaxID=1605721 RepID=A0A0B5JBK5_9VIRU|nr:hypothetical protein TW95_gp1672 [Pandoravirus inopinatum]AJF98406.1 hypothetical protein [Pandoravirus inopinatum]